MTESKEVFTVIDKRGQEKPVEKKPVEKKPVEEPLAQNPQQAQGKLMIQGVKHWPVHNLGLLCDFRGLPIGLYDFETGKAIASGEPRKMFVSHERYADMLREQTEEQRAADRAKSLNAQKKMEKDNA